MHYFSLMQITSLVMKKPIILHITPSLMIGGAEKLLIDLMENFQTNPDNLFEHQVAYFQTGPFLAKLQKLNIKAYQVSGLIRYYDPICFFKLLLLIKKTKPHKIHSMLWSANLYARLIGKILKLPVICAIHSYYNSGNKAQDNLFKLKLDQITSHWAEQIITVSLDISQKTKRDLPKLNPNKIKTINNGVKLPNQIEPANQPNLNTNSFFTIGHVGRLVPIKNQALLIQALSLVKKQTPNFKAVIIGQGPLEFSLKDLVSQLGLTNQVKFIKSSQPAKYYPKFNCFVLPSHQEGQSIALLEAMSFGITPIITQTNNQVKKHDIIKNLENGLICKAQANQLALTILNLIKSPKKNQKLAQTAQKTILNHFNLDQTAKQYLDLYKYN